VAGPRPARNPAQIPTCGAIATGNAGGDPRRACPSPARSSRAWSPRRAAALRRTLVCAAKLFFCALFSFNFEQHAKLCKPLSLPGVKRGTDETLPALARRAAGTALVVRRTVFRWFYGRRAGLLHARDGTLRHHICQQKVPASASVSKACKVPIWRCKWGEHLRRLLTRAPLSSSPAGQPQVYHRSDRSRAEPEHRLPQPRASAQGESVTHSIDQHLPKKTKQKKRTERLCTRQVG
jgi:hypothetical protein